MDPEARLAEVETELRQLHETAGDAAFTDEQQTSWDQLETEREQLRGQIASNERRRAVARELLNRPGHTEAGEDTGPSDNAEQSRSGARGPEVMRRVVPFDGAEVRSLQPLEARDKALKALEIDELTSHLEQRQLDGLDRVLRTRNKNTDGSVIARRLLLTEQEDYRSAFMKLMARPNAVLTAEEGRAVAAFDEFRAMNIGTDADGGYGVPVVIDPTIILTAQGHPNDFFQLGRVEVITTDKWKGVTSAGVSWSFDAESAEVSNDQPTLAGPEVPAHKAQGFIPYSIEVGMDYPGFASEMSTLLAEGYSELLVDTFTTGTGTNQPTGIVTALTGSASEVDNATTGTLAIADVHGLWEALPIRYRGNANSAWMSHTSVNDLIQQFGSGNDSAFTVDFTAEGVMILKGRRAYMNDYMGELNGAVSGLLIVGDWRNYLIAQRAGMSVELVPHLFATGANRPSGERGWYAWARVGADSINDAGFRMLSDAGA